MSGESRSDGNVLYLTSGGSVMVNDQPMVAGDGLAVADENTPVQIRGVDEQSNIIVFNLRK